MAVTKPNMTYAWGDSSALLSAPSNAKIQTGWTVEKPPVEYFNWLDNRQDHFIQHVNERGVPQWDTSTTYLVGAICYGSDGVIYRAAQQNAGNDPITDDGTYWVTFGGSMRIIKKGCYVANTTIGSLVGVVYQEPISFAGTAINTNIGTSYTTVLSLTGKYVIDPKGGPLVSGVLDNDMILGLHVDTTEDTGDGLGVRVTTDGVVTFSGEIGRAATDRYFYWAGAETLYVKPGFSCNSSFKVEFIRIGTFASADSVVKMNGLYIHEIF